MLIVSKIEKKNRFYTILIKLLQIEKKNICCSPTIFILDVAIKWKLSIRYQKLLKSDLGAIIINNNKLSTSLESPVFYKWVHFQVAAYSKLDARHIFHKECKPKNTFIFRREVNMLQIKIRGNFNGTFHAFRVKSFLQINIFLT